MAEKKQFMYRITFKCDNDGEMRFERIICDDPVKMLQRILVHYPESVDDGCYIKIEGAIF